MVAPAALLNEKLPPFHWGLGQAHSHLHMGPGTGAGGATGSKDRFVLINQKRFCCLSQLGLWGKRRFSGRVIKNWDQDPGMLQQFPPEKPGFGT